MSISMTLLTNEPILICEFQSDFNEDDVMTIWSESVRLTQKLDGPIYRINDTRKIKVDFGTVVMVLAEAARGTQAPGSVADPKFKEVAVVEMGSLGELASKSIGQEQYGGFNVPVFESMEEALTYVRSQVDNTQKN